MSWKLHENSLTSASKAQGALLSPHHHIWVSAHAGTGKTETLTHRIAALLLHNPALAPRHILALTYTRAAASELALRIPARIAEWAKEEGEKQEKILKELLGRPPTSEDEIRLKSLPALLQEESIWATTLHGLCGEILGRFPLEAGLRPGFRILSESEQEEALKEAQRKLFAIPSEEVVWALDELVSQLGDRGTSDLVSLVATSWDKLLGVITHAEEEGGIEAWLTNIVGEDKEAKELALTPEDMTVLTRWQTLLEGSDKSSNQGILAHLLAAKKSPQTPTLWHALFLNDKAYKQLGGTKDVKEFLAASGLQEEIEALRTKVTSWMRTRHTAAGYAGTKALLVWVAAARTAYEAEKTTGNALDYADMIRHTTNLVAGWDAPLRAWVMEQLDRDIWHILLDEAQDNSHTQNAIVQALAAELMASGGTRTFLAVGDMKQSIYRFQGAAPDRFKGLKSWMEKEGGEATRVGELAHSFRSTTHVLAMADTLWQVMTGEDIVHHPTRPHAAGWVIRRPLVVTGKAPSVKEYHWRMPEERMEESRSNPALGHALVKEIETLVGHTPLLSTEKEVMYKDVMVLVKRKSVGTQLAATLAQHGIPVRTGWPLKTLPLFIEDVMALVQSRLTPTNRQVLAHTLSIPWRAMEEEQKQAFQTLLENEENSPVSTHVQDTPFTLLAFLKSLESEAFFSHAAKSTGGSLTQAHSWWQALVASALGHPNPQEWVEKLKSEGLPNLTQSAEDAVTISTIHSAKGLEAPVVILAETTGLFTEIKSTEKLWWEEGATGPVGVWLSQSGTHPDTVPLYQERLKQAEVEATKQDNIRAFYVALTRAKEGLIVLGDITGSEDKKTEHEDFENKPHAYAALTTALKNLGAAEDADGTLTLGAFPPAKEKISSQGPKLATFCTPPAEGPSLTPQTPASYPSTPRPVPFKSPQLTLGSQVHAALQGIKQGLPSHVISLAAATRTAHPHLFQKCWQEIDIIDENGKPARLDMLSEVENQLWVIDFKTDATPPTTLQGVSESYKNQVKSYASAVSETFGKPTKAALLFTTNGCLIEVV